MRYLLVSEQSRKAKAVRQTYEHLRNRVEKQIWSTEIQLEAVQGHEGVPVPRNEKHRILNLKVQDEHLSPYIQTDLNLFQMHMLDDGVNMTVYRAPHGWLVVYEGVIDGPQPFGNLGYDTR